jgi:hypothetical protein
MPAEGGQADFNRHSAGISLKQEVIKLIFFEQNNVRENTEPVIGPVVLLTARKSERKKYCAIVVCV